MQRPPRTDTGRTPTEIRLHRRSAVLEVAFDDGSRFELPAEYLRVYSPSAEVRGHGPGQAVLVTGKEDVAITSVEPVGNYAVRLAFDDGHSSGIYSFDLLYDLGANRNRYWQEYLDALADAGHRRRYNPDED
ncbi:gamma-butyrobetaine hydroxylase-like domain-containing protein [Arhodomonas sp. AD133]|uniref:gamma-butyrobetaine hydroxylase-like domain-containing protein n=1 Tax=Arhodomonas sp. AD133 TaxID=3415009 RepID=UPI003EBE17F7